MDYSQFGPAYDALPILELRALSGNASVELNPLQQALVPHADTLLSFWVGVWALTAAFLLARLIQQHLRVKDRTEL